MASEQRNKGGDEGLVVCTLSAQLSRTPSAPRLTRCVGPAGLRLQQGRPGKPKTTRASAPGRHSTLHPQEKCLLPLADAGGAAGVVQTYLCPRKTLQSPAHQPRRPSSVPRGAAKGLSCLVGLRGIERPVRPRQQPAPSARKCDGVLKGRLRLWHHSRHQQRHFFLSASSDEAVPPTLLPTKPEMRSKQGCKGGTWRSPRLLTRPSAEPFAAPDPRSHSHSSRLPAAEVAVSSSMHA